MGKVLAGMQLENLIAWDMFWSQRLVAWGNGRWRRILFWMLARSGDSMLWLLVAGVLLWLGSPLGWELLLTVVVAVAVTAVAKSVFRRPRPVAKRAIAMDKYAFPSGHATRAGALSVTLGFAFPEYAVVYLGWALAVALARVGLARHYVSDVAAGLILGICVGIGLRSLM